MKVLTDALENHQAMTVIVPQRFPDFQSEIYRNQKDLEMKMTDRELLELAAKAAELKYDQDKTDEIGRSYSDHLGLWIWHWGEWYNPLTDDGDALRLAVKLKLLVDTDHCCAMPIDKSGKDPNDWSDGELDDDPYAATRRAIVRAAAEIGKNTKRE